MWFRLMIIAFFLNGLSSFGLRILADMGLASQHTSTYLIFWYLGGLFFVLILFFRTFKIPKSKDIFIGSVLGLFSVGGQTSLGLALAQGLDGNVVYPVTLAGGLFIVVLAGIILFKERVGKAGLIGIALGVISLILLSFS